MTDGRRTDDRAWPSYQLTLGAFGSGELKSISHYSIKSLKLKKNGQTLDFMGYNN